MRVLHFSTWDRQEGAANNAYRIHSSLREAGVHSRMVVRYKRAVDPDVVRVRPGVIELARLKVHRALEILRVGTKTFSFDWESSRFDRARLNSIAPDGADILFLHWTNWLLTVDSIRRLYEHFKCPIVWFLCDYEPLTGGCNYPWHCDKFRTHCGKCPQLGSAELQDRTWRTWEKKKSLLGNVPITFVCGGDDLLGEARRSPLFGHCATVRVPGCFDEHTFKPSPQDHARQKFGLRADAKVIFFGSVHLSEERKGMLKLIKSLETLRTSLEGTPRPFGAQDVQLLIAGRKIEHLRSSGPLPFESRYVGFLSNDSDLACAYQAADIFVSASTQDTGPGMIVESLLCGTPVAAFDIPFCRSIVTDGQNGYLARAGDTDGLAEAIRRVLAHDPPAEMREAAYRSVKDMYSSKLAVKVYLRLFEDLMKRAR